MTWSAIHQYLGMPPGPVTNEMIDSIVTDQLTESADLDFKSQLPPSKGLNTTDFPKDLAAMANSGGGTIVYGIEEQDKTAAQRTDIDDLSEVHERSMRSCAITAISPPIFGLDIQRIGPAGSQVVVLTVPSSTDGPHLIYRNDLFGAPIRNDADTVWMKERQIEAMYRARFDERRRSNEALTGLFAEAMADRDTTTRAWITLAAHPRGPTSHASTLDRDQVRDIATTGLGEGRSFVRPHAFSPLASTALQNPRPGLRRWVLANTATSDIEVWKQSWAAVHHNGAVTISSTIGGHRNSSSDHWPGGTIECTAIEGAVAEFMGLVHSAGDRLGIDEFEARVGIEWDGPNDMLILARDSHGFSYDGNSTPLGRYTPVDTTILINVSDEDYQRQVADLARDCINQGGVTFLQAVVEQQ